MLIYALWTHSDVHNFIDDVSSAMTSKRQTALIFIFLVKTKTVRAVNAYAYAAVMTRKRQQKLNECVPAFLCLWCSYITAVLISLYLWVEDRILKRENEEEERKKRVLIHNVSDTLVFGMFCKQYVIYFSRQCAPGFLTVKYPSCLEYYLLQGT